jgi:hypothetical protein
MDFRQLRQNKSDAFVVVLDVQEDEEIIAGGDVLDDVVVFVLGCFAKYRIIF